MIRPEELKELAADSFELQCGSIHLYKHGTTREQGSRGAGYFRQLPSGELAMVMFVTERPPSLEETWGRLGSRKSGELFNEEDYFILEAQDFNGRKWTALRVHPSFSGFSDGTTQSNCRAEATIQELTSTETRPHKLAGSSLQIWYRGHVSFPFNARVNTKVSIEDRPIKRSFATVATDFICGDLRFIVHYEVDFLKVQVSSEKENITQGLEWRINETLEFLLAHRLSWTAIEKREIGEMCCSLTGAPVMNLKGRMRQPVPFKNESPAVSEAARILFCKFLTNILSQQPDGPDLSVAVKVALEGNLAPIHIHGLQVGIAVESILHSHFSDLGKSPDDFREEIERVKEAIGSITLSERTVKRLNGMMDSMHSASAKSRLLELVDQKIIDHGLVKAWELARHPGAHGSFNKRVDQKYINACWRCVMLFYKLIFSVIGYEGPYRNYGELGWPWVQLGDAAD